MFKAFSHAINRGFPFERGLRLFFFFLGIFSVQPSKLGNLAMFSRFPQGQSNSRTVASILFLLDHFSACNGEH
jgi:hypothetical protein